MKLLISLVLFSVVGCTSIDQPIAQQNLVNADNLQNKEIVSSNLWRALLSEDQGKSVFVNGNEIILGKAYMSASGQHCRRLNLNGAGRTAVPRVSCKSLQSESWHYVDAVLSEYSEGQSSLQGAK